MLANFGYGGENFQKENVPEGLKIMVSELRSTEKKLLDPYNEALKVLQGP